MQERHAVLGVHHAVDTIAARVRGAVDAVSGLVPCYQKDAVGWSVQLERLLREAGKLDGAKAFPEVSDALAHFIEFKADTVWHSAQRLLVVAALSRVSERHAPGGDAGHLVQQALEHFVGPERDPKQLHRAIADPDLLSHDTWHLGVSELVGSGHLEGSFASVAAPCTGELVPVTIDGDTDPVTVLSTVYHHPGLTVADLEPTLLDPAKWPACDDFWCAMTVEGTAGGVDTYLEEVASDCSGWRIVTRLDFAKRIFSDGSATLDYWLADDQTNPCDGLVEVDEGSILVEPLPGSPTGVTVSTTKRLRFRGPMDGAQLAMTACALGWDGAGEQFVFGCTTPGSGAASPASRTTKAGPKNAGGKKSPAEKPPAKKPPAKKPPAKKPPVKQSARKKPVTKKRGAKS